MIIRSQTTSTAPDSSGETRMSVLSYSNTIDQKYTNALDPKYTNVLDPRDAFAVLSH